MSISNDQTYSDKVNSEAEANKIAGEQAKAETKARIAKAKKAKLEAKDKVATAEKAKLEAEAKAAIADQAKSKANTRVANAVEAKAKAEARVAAAEEAKARSKTRVVNAEKAKVNAEARVEAAEKAITEIKAIAESATKQKIPDLKIIKHPNGARYYEDKAAGYAIATDMSNAFTILDSILLFIRSFVAAELVRKEIEAKILVAELEKVEIEVKEVAEEQKNAETEAREAAEEKVLVEAEVKEASEEQTRLEKEAQLASSNKARAQAEAEVAAHELAAAEREVKEAEDEARSEAREVAEALVGRGQVIAFISTLVMTVAVATVVGLPIYRRWREGGRPIEELAKQKQFKSGTSNINTVSSAQPKDVVSKWLEQSMAELKEEKKEASSWGKITNMRPEDVQGLLLMHSKVDMILAGLSKQILQQPLEAQPGVQASKSGLSSALASLANDPAVSELLSPYSENKVNSLDVVGTTAVSQVDDGTPNGC